MERRTEKERGEVKRRADRRTRKGEGKVEKGKKKQEKEGQRVKNMRRPHSKTIGSLDSGPYTLDGSSTNRLSHESAIAN